MAFEDKEAELGLLLTRTQNEQNDSRAAYAIIRQKLNDLKDDMPLPEDLFERDLEAAFAAEQIDQQPRARLDKVMYRRGRR